MDIRTLRRASNLWEEFHGETLVGGDRSDGSDGFNARRGHRRLSRWPEFIPRRMVSSESCSAARCVEPGRLVSLRRGSGPDGAARTNLEKWIVRPVSNG